MRSSVFPLLLLFLTLSFSLFASRGNSNDISPLFEKKWHIKDILADQNVPQLAKDIYQDKPWSLVNESDSILLSILDSFPDMSPFYKGFYFVVIARTVDKSDGAYAEGLGSSGKEYIDNNLKQFLNFFIGRNKLPRTYLKKWEAITFLEISLWTENADSTFLTKTISAYDQKCKDSTPEQKVILSEFENGLKKEMAIYLSKQ